ncbi:hypothetical protein BDF20DRAFT_860838 [Mycotypha africana]|uniref:uncharacterized protein n=1 Tax=Mycotypha africana TaxID=64632 RepID=UPI0023000093|nr:uncharacterized protein BDF20DRAFT_860838 [Mycotypha africana]KAI8984608.1 hypothetical protein BDF20DRAFT_860838 [Mycotypha africana]
MRDLSLELVELIAQHCPSSKDRASLCRVNRWFYNGTIRLLYRNVMLNTLNQYYAFGGSLKANHNNRCYTRRLDLSSLTTRGARLTKREADKVIVAEELTEILRNCYYLEELSIGEQTLRAYANSSLRQPIFHHETRLTTIEFIDIGDRSMIPGLERFLKVRMDRSTRPRARAGWASSTQDAAKSELLGEDEEGGKDVGLKEATTVVHDDWLIPAKLESISFYMCVALSQENFFIPFFDTFAASEHCQRLRKLDMAYTRVTGRLFSSLRKVTQLTHLSVKGCHVLSCCSPFIDFIENSHDLVELNMDMSMNGIGSTRFCADCLGRIVRSVGRKIKSLDMGGHDGLTDTVLERWMKQPSDLLQHVKYVSLAYCRHISQDGLRAFIAGLPHLFYLNLAQIAFKRDFRLVPPLLEMIHSTNAHIKVLEVGCTHRRCDDEPLYGWKPAMNGRRFFYSRDEVEPRFVYSNKILFTEQEQLSPLNRYWSFIS